MDRNRGFLVLGGAVTLLVAAATVTILVRKRQLEEEAQEIAEVEEMIEDYEQYVHAESKPAAKKKRTTAAKNGRVTGPASA